MNYKIYFLFLFLVYFLLTDSLKSQDENEPHGNLNIQRYAVETGSDVYDNPLFTNVNLTNEQNPQNEPSVRISRTNPNYVVAAWRDFRLGYNPPVRRIGYSYSTNGGVTWSVSQLLPSPLPNHATQSDPVLTNDNNGYFYLATTSREQTNTRGETVIYRSTNNGANWVEYSTAAQSSAFEDKEWIACDLVQGSPYFNSLNVTWTRIGGSGGIKFTKSTNGGLNWTFPVNVGDNSSGQGSNIAIGTNHYIYVVWQSSGIKFDRSTNGGANFGTDYQLSNVTSTGDTYPFICVDYSNHSTRGNVYVTWADSRQGSMDIWFQKSTNGGANWLTSPVRVNDVTTNAQYWPAIQCDTSGVLYLIYYDERISSSQVNSYIAYSTDAGTTWNNQRLSDVSFPLIYINSDVRTGDYIGIDAYAGKVFPVWTDDRAGTPNQEVYTANVSGILSVPISQTGIPERFTLYQNYPNPFNPETKIKVDIPETGVSGIKVYLSVYDVLGREVAVLADEQLRAGTYEFRWDASNVSGGVYFYRITAGSPSTSSGKGFIDTKKMILVK
jgi:hypothetical protein